LISGLSIEAGGTNSFLGPSVKFEQRRQAGERKKADYGQAKQAHEVGRMGNRRSLRMGEGFGESADMQKVRMMKDPDDQNGLVANIQLYEVI
jgi:hypothetical protein